MLEELQEIRRHIHKQPEIALKEYKTRDYIVSKLREFGFEEIYSGIAGTGVVAVIKGLLDESVLLRGDMDALSL